MVRVTPYIKMLLCFALVATPAKAQEVSIPIDFSGRYDFALAGIPFGKIDISLNQTATHYKAKSDIEITGIARVFVQHESHTTSQGSGHNFSYPNVQYASDYQTRKKKRAVTYTKKNGKIISERFDPPDAKAGRPLIEQQDKDKAYDPLAVGLAARTELAHAIKDGRKQFSLTYYDGKSLTQADFAIRDERVITVNDHKYPCYRLTARRKPLAGYTPKELSRVRPDEPNLAIYFTHDERLLPILFEIPMLLGTVTAKLQES